MRKSHKVLKEAIERVGVKEVASEMNLSHSMIYKWCQDPNVKKRVPQPSGAANPLDRLHKLYQVTKDLAIIHWICEKANGHYVQNPTTNEEFIDQRFFNNTQALIHEFSEALQIISESFTKGRHVSSKEAKDIRKEWEDVKRLGESFVKACEAGVFLESRAKKKR